MVDENLREKVKEEYEKASRVVRGNVWGRTADYIPIADGFMELRGETVYVYRLKTRKQGE